MQDMKTIVVYSSRTGFTERYARWIAEELECECKTIKAVNEKLLAEYDCIIYGGWMMASNISDMVRLRKMKGLEDKKMVVFAVGITSMDSEDSIKRIEEMNFAPVESSRIPFFYFEGGIDYEKMGFMNKKMLGAMRKSLNKKEHLTSEESELLGKLEFIYSIL